MASRVEKATHRVELLVGDEWAHLGVRVKAITQLDRLGDVGHTGHHLIEAVGLDVQSRTGDAALTMIEEDRIGGAGDHDRGISIGEHDVGALASQLEAHFLQVPRGGLGHKPTYFGRSGEHDLVDLFVGHECGAGRLAIPRDNVDNTVGESGLGHDLGQIEGRQWRLFGRLEDDRVPVARAGPSFQAAMSSGKFHGMIWPTTPMGSLKV